MRRIVVYTTPTTGTETQDLLAGLGARFETVDITRNQLAARRIRAAGYTSLPVVLVTHPDGTPYAQWSGHRPELVRSVVNHIQGDAA